MFKFTEGIPRDSFDRNDFLLGFEGVDGLIQESKTMEVLSASTMEIDVAFLIIKGDIPFPGMDSITVTVARGIFGGGRSFTFSGNHPAYLSLSFSFSLSLFLSFSLFLFPSFSLFPDIHFQTCLL